MRHHGAGTYHRPRSDIHACHDRAIGANRRAGIDLCEADIPVTIAQQAEIRIGCAGPEVIREYNVRADEYTASKSDTMIHARVVLDLAIVANDDVKVDEHALSYYAASTNRRSRANVGIVPDFRACSNSNRRFDQC